MNEDLVCSMPGSITGEDDPYYAVSSPDGNNYQMMSYCPHIDKEKCGISSEEGNTDFVLDATEEEQMISTIELRYRDGSV